MEIFLITLRNVCVILCYGIPAYVMGKTKFIKKESIACISKYLLYICSPCLLISSLCGFEYSNELAINLLVAFIISIVIQSLAIILLYLIFYKKIKQGDENYKICSVASILGNMGFIGIPILRSILPEEAVMYASAFLIAMNLLVWTVVAYVLTGDKKFLSAKNVFLNPSSIGFIVGVLLFLFRIKLFSELTFAIDLLGKTSTPLCMLILGLRLGYMNLSEIFKVPKTYIFCGVKLILYPLFVFTVTYFLPINTIMKTALFITACCPSASVTLGLAEMYDKGQKLVGNIIFMSTMLFLISLPFMSLLINLY